MLFPRASFPLMVLGITKKFTFSLLEGTLRTYITDSDFDNNNLSLNLLIRSRKSLENMGSKILKKIPSEIIKKHGIKLIDTMVEAGSGAMPINSLESMGIIFNKKYISPNRLAKKFRMASTPIIGYINDDQYVIDLKAIPLDCSKDVTEIICEILK